MIRSFATAVLLLGTVALAPVADARGRDRYPPSAGSLSPGGEAPSIKAWSEFCSSGFYARECAVDRSEPQRIVLTPALWRHIVSVNRGVNASIASVSDEDHRGRRDVWDLAEDRKGDCEDYALLKRKLLVGAGLPRRAMRMTAVADGADMGHAVLTLITDRGDFVLDNRTDEVMGWADTGYTFVKRESQDEVGWVSLGNTPTAPAGPRPAWASAIAP